MKRLNHNKEFALFVLVIGLILFASYFAFDTSETNSGSSRITAAIHLELGSNISEIVANSTFENLTQEDSYDFIFEEPENVTEIIENITVPELSLDNITVPSNLTMPDNVSVPDNITLPDAFTIPENATHDFVYNESEIIDNITIPVNLTIPANLTLPENLSNVSVPESISEEVSLKKVKEKSDKKSMNELGSILDSAVDYHCEDISMFLKRCILQTEKELCHLENKEIVCSGVMNVESYSAELTENDTQTFAEKGIPIYKGSNKTEYFRPELGTRFVVDWNSIKNIHIGFKSDSFYIQDFYYGTCDDGDNCTIDVGVEIKPTDSEVTLPQLHNLTGRFDFVNDAIDTSGFDNDGTVFGATHTYERYEFDGNDNYIETNNETLTSVNYSLFGWYSFDIDAGSQAIANSFYYTAAHNYIGIVGRYFSGTGLQVGNCNNNGWGAGTVLTYAWAPTVGQWYHIGHTYNGSEVKLYIDGVNVASDNTITAPGFNANTIFRIGAMHSSGDVISNFLNGSEESVLVWNSTLTSQEIELVYNETRFNTSGNTITYSGKFTGGLVKKTNRFLEWKNITWTSTEPTDTSIELRYRSGNFTAVDETDSNLVSYWKLNRSDGTNAFGTSIPDNNQVLHMKFNSESDFTDYSGQGNDGTNSGTAYTQEGYIRGARSFDGSSGEHVSISNADSLNIISNFSISVWLKRGVFAGTFAGIVGNNFNTGYWMEVRKANSKVEVFINGTGVADIAISNIIVPLDEWIHVVLVWDNDNKNASFYANGEYNSYDVPAKRLDAGGGGTTVYIGEDGRDGIGYPYKGNMDNLRIYNTSLNATQIKELYSKEAGTYDNKGSNHGKAENDVDRDSGLFESDGALSFDGNNEGIDVTNAASLDFTSNFSIVSWVYVKGKTGYNVILSRFGSLGYWFGLSNNNAKPVLYINTSTRYELADAEISLNQWVQLAAVYNASDPNVNLYVDGSKVASTTTGVIPPGINSNSYTTSIGYDVERSNYPFNGSIDSVLVYNRTLSSTEISDLYFTWSGWNEYDSASPIQLKNETANTLQYQARLNTTNNSLTPVLNSVDVAFTYDINTSTFSTDMSVGTITNYYGANEIVYVTDPPGESNASEYIVPDFQMTEIGPFSEGLEITSDEKIYSGIMQSEFRFFIENKGDKDEIVDINFLFQDKGSIGKVSEVIYEDFEIKKPIYGKKEFYCASDWEFINKTINVCEDIAGLIDDTNSLNIKDNNISLTNNTFKENIVSNACFMTFETWECSSDYNLTNEGNCDNVTEDKKTCTIDKFVIGAESVIKQKEVFSGISVNNGNKQESLILENKIDEEINNLQFSVLSDEDKENKLSALSNKKHTFREKKKINSILLKKGEIKEFKAILTFPESSRGEFMIEAKSESNSYALLDPWWQSNWAYKLPIEINATKYNRTDYLIQLGLNFTKLFADANTSGTMCDNCYRVVEYNKTNGALLCELPSRFLHRAVDYDAATNAYGRIDWVLNGTTVKNNVRNYYIFFDKTENGAKSAPVAFDNSQIFFYPETDLDRDGKREIVAGTSSGFAVVINGEDPAHNANWTSPDLGSYVSLAIGDTNNNDIPDLVAAPHYYTDDIAVYEYNKTTDDYEEIGNFITNTNHYGISVCDIDRDGYDEIIVPGYTYDNVKIWGWNGAAYVLEATLTITDPAYWKATTNPAIQEKQVEDQFHAGCGDIDNDGEFEIFTSHYFDEGINIWNYNGVSYEHEQLIWEYSGGMTGIALADPDDDGKYEALIGYSDRFRFFDYDHTGYRKSSFGPDTGTYIGYPDVLDWDLDGNMETVYGDYEGNIHVYNLTSTGGYTLEYGIGIDVGSYNYATRFGDIDNDGTVELITGNSAGALFAFNSSTTTQEWTKAYGLGYISSYYGDSLLISGEKDPGALGVGAPKITLGEVMSAPPQSRIDNTGTKNNISAYVTMKVQNYSAGNWDTLSLVVNMSDQNISVGNYIKLDTLWLNAGGWNTSNYSDGTYRVWVELTDAAGKVMRNTDDLTLMNTSYEFEIDSTPPVISDYLPLNNTDVVDPATTEENTYEYTVTITTDEPAMCKFSQQVGDGWDDMYSISIDYQTTHYHRVQLINENNYDYYFICQDSVNNPSSVFHLNFSSLWTDKPTVGPAAITPELFNNTETITMSATCYDLDTVYGMSDCRFVGTQEGVSHNPPDWANCLGTSCACSCTVDANGVGSPGCPDISLQGDWVYEAECRDNQNIVDSKQFQDTAVKANVTWHAESQTEIPVIEEGTPPLSNGIYWIDPDGPGGNASFQVYCDMSDEGGGWMLLDNFVSSLVGDSDPYGAAISDSNIKNLVDLANAGYTTHLTNTEHPSYTRVKGYLQMFYSGATIGYIQKTLPSYANEVYVKWGNWYGATAALKIGGSTVQTLSANYGAATYRGNYALGNLIRLEESSGIFWAGEIWVKEFVSNWTQEDDGSSAAKAASSCLAIKDRYDALYENSSTTLTYDKTVTVDNIPGGESREAGWHQDGGSSLYSGVTEWSVCKGNNCSGVYVPKDDYLVTGDYNGQVRYIKSFGDRAFKDNVYISDMGSYSWGCGIADFVEDGDYDFVSGAQGNMYLFTHTAEGTFSATLIGTITTPSYVMDMATQDFTGDSHYDFVVSGFNDDLWLFAGNGSGDFKKIVITADGPDTYIYGKAALDFDDDGDYDVVFGTNTNKIYILNNTDGAGTFTVLDTGLTARSTNNYGVAAGDMDNDGFADILVEYRGYGIVDYFKGNGDGTFQARAATNIDGPNNYMPMDVWDFDKDGNLDIVATDYSYENVFFYAGHGDFNFDSSVDLGMMGYNLMGICAPVINSSYDKYHKQSSASGSAEWSLSAPQHNVTNETLCYSWNYSLSASDCIPEQDTANITIANVTAYEKCNVTVNNTADLSANVTLLDACDDGAYWNGSDESEVSDNYSPIDCGNQSLIVPAAGQTSYIFRWNESGVIILYESGWKKNGTCSQFVAGRQYYYENVTFNNTDPVNFTNVFWQVSIPSSNYSVTTNGSVNVSILGGNTTASIWGDCMSPPVVTLVYPVNNTILPGRNIDFRCNAQSPSLDNINNLTLFIWDSGGILVYSNTQSISGTSVTQNWTFILPSAGTYEFNCKAIDNNTLSNMSLTNNTFTIIFPNGIDNVTTDVNTELKPVDSLIQLPQKNNLVARWDFVTNADDSSGQDHNGTVHGATHTFERYEFDGTDDYLDFGTNIASMRFQRADNFTVSVWVKPNTTTTNSAGIVSHFDGSNYDGWSTVVTANDGIITVLGSTTSLKDYVTWANVLTVDEWNHLVWTTNGTNSTGYKLYVNGVSQTGVINDNDCGVFVDYTNASGEIGKLPDYDIELAGDIENVYIWNTSLSAEEVMELYRATLFNTEGNTVEYIGRYTNAISTGSNATVWKNLSWLETEPTGTNIKLRYRLGNYTPVDTSDSDLIGYWKLNRSDGTNAFANSNPDNYQVLHMKFNNVTDFTDYSGQGNDGTNSGSAYTDLGYVGGARSFDGTNDYVAIPSSYSFGPNHTLSLWLKFNSVSGDIGILGKGHVYSDYLNSRVTYFRAEPSGITEYIDLHHPAFTVNKWYHIIITQDDNKNWSLFVDGSYEDYDTSNNDTLQILNIGRGYAGKYMNGLIDNVRIYNTSFNVTQVKELYSKEAGTYDEQNRNLGTAENDVGRAQGIFSNDGALEFDGKDDFINISNSSTLDNPSNISVSVWLKLNENSKSMQILSKGIYQQNGWDMYMLNNGWAGFSTFSTGTDNGAWIMEVLPTNQWHHIVGTTDSSNNKIYLNGVFKGNSGGIGNLTSTNIALTIGNPKSNRSNFNFFNGTIDSITIYNRTLTQGEIENLYINWSGWSAYSLTSPINLNNQTGRAIQYQALLNTTNSSVTPVLGAVSEDYFKNPLVYLDSPANNTITTNKTINFFCNATAFDSDRLKNITLYIWNASNVLIYSNTHNLNGINNQSNWTYTFTNRGIFDWNCEAVNIGGFSDFADDNFTLTILKWVEINLTIPINGSVLPRGNELIPYEDDMGVVDNYVNIIANVYDNETLKGVNNINCSFYFDSSYIGYNLTNSSGICNLNYDKHTQAVGLRNISVNLSSVPANYTLADNDDYSMLHLEQWTIVINIYNFRNVGGFATYYEDDIAGVNVTIRKNGNFNNVTNMTIILTNQLDIEFNRLHLDNFTQFGAGIYYAEVVVPAFNWLRWKGFAESNFTNYGIMNATSSLHTDVNVDPPVPIVNSTVVNTSNSVFENTTITYYRHGPLFIHSLYEKTINLADQYAVRSGIINDSTYRIKFSIPDNNSLIIDRLNSNKIHLRIKTQSADYSGILPSDIRNLSKVIACNISSFQKATIFIQKNNFEPDHICECQNWNYSSANCDGSWLCNLTSDYEYKSNTTHFWFNITHFSGFAGGLAFDANLSIWDSTDPEAGSQKIVPNQQAMFYSNYSNSSNGLTINGSDIFCNIEFNIGGWTPLRNMTFNQTSMLYEYNRTFPAVAIYEWNVTCNGAVLNYDILEANDTINISTDITAPYINFTSPTTTSNCHNQNWISANVTVIDFNLDTIIINLYNSSKDLINFTNSSASPLFFNFTGLADGTYYLNATANDTFSNRNITETRRIMLDTTAPAVNLISPPNMSQTQSPVLFIFQVTDTTYANCSLNINGNSVANLTNLSSGSYVFNQSLALGDYEWNVSCTDCIGLFNETKSWNVSIIPPLPPSRGGGAGGGARPTFSINVGKLCVREKVKISITPTATGQLVVSHFERGKWFYITTLNVKKGVAYFIPDKPGPYRFDFKFFNNIAASVTVVAEICARAELPSTSPLIDLLKSEIVKETKEEVIKEKEKTEIEEFYEKPQLIPDAPIFKLTKLKIKVFISSLLILLILTGFIFRIVKILRRKHNIKKRGRERKNLKKKFGVN